MIPLGHSRTVFSGALPSGEIFATGLWANEAPSDEAATQAQADAFGTEISNAWGASGSPVEFNSPGMILQRVTVYSYLTNSGRASFVAEHSLSKAGASIYGQIPDQCAIVATLLTGSAGRRNRGRMYWPCTAPAISQGQMQNAQCENYAGWLSDLITAFNSHIGSQHMVVLSQVAGSSKSISAIGTDTRIDIQRRRANRETINSRYTNPVQ